MVLFYSNHNNTVIVVILLLYDRIVSKIASVFLSLSYPLQSHFLCHVCLRHLILNALSLLYSSPPLCCLPLLPNLISLLPCLVSARLSYPSIIFLKYSIFSNFTNLFQLISNTLFHLFSLFIFCISIPFFLVFLLRFQLQLNSTAFICVLFFSLRIFVIIEFFLFFHLDFIFLNIGLI